jgi:TonB family protein
MIHLDFDERYQDDLVVGRAISLREGVMYSVVLHVVLALIMVLAPGLMIFQAAEDSEALRLEQDSDAERMVFVQPMLDLPSEVPPPSAELSDLDRRSQAPEVAETPANPLPFALGNSPERTEAAEQEAEQARGPESPEPPAPEPSVPESSAAEAPAGETPPAEPSSPRQPEMEIARATPPAETGLIRPPIEDGSLPRDPMPRGGGSLGEALRNLQQYVEQETFHNPQGGALDPGATIQFDTKGVEFGPWLRRFVAQVRRNWFIPHAAMTFRGRVVLQFNIHRDGSITDLVVLQPSGIDAFNRAAVNAIRGSSPTEPLPPEYPDPMALFTVSFFYNEQPPGQLP